MTLCLSRPSDAAQEVQLSLSGSVVSPPANAPLTPVFGLTLPLLLSLSSGYVWATMC